MIEYVGGQNMKKDLNCGIYTINNHVTGQRYIGQSRNIKKRIAEHMNKLKK